MRTVTRATLGLFIVVAALGAAGCGKAGSSGAKSPNQVSGQGCAPVAGQQLVVLSDDKHLQAVDNVVPAVNSKVADPALIAALDKVSAALSPQKLIGLNKATDVDRKTSKVAAQEFSDSQKLTDGVGKGPGGKIVVGAANFSENQTLGYLYQTVLTAAGYDASVQQIGNRELYEPSLEKGEVQVVPEYVGTLTEFLNKKVNGATATTLASGDLDKTYTALQGLGDKVGLKFGKPAEAADQNAFAVTKAVADKYSLQSLSDFAAKCSGKATVLGGPAECPQRPFCQPGLEKTYNMSFGRFVSLDAGGPQSKGALTGGTATIALVFSSDAALASG